MAEHENKVNENEEVSNADVEIEPLSDKEMEEVAGGTVDADEISTICSQQLCS
jgi:hypothetical protein